MEKTIGFIGSGNMGKAIIKGLLKTGFATADQIIASRRNEAALEQLAQELGIRTTTHNPEVAKQADILFLAVKPNLYDAVIEEVRANVPEETVVVNIAAGKSIASIEAAFGREVKVARAMPNTPALVGEGMVGLCFNELVSTKEQAEIAQLFASLGKVEIIPETLISAVIGASGSSPAILYMVIESMADGAVRAGMPRQQAYTFAAQAMLGSAKMVLETGEHPGKLKDDVCSPGGTTIEAVATAEAMGLRSAILAAVEASIEKSKNMEQA